ncbi:MAG: tetratricopeptide repeat protein [Acidimicrobiales bacterium]|nr:tetratricopeptide repeat protein [Acidimicrobiales bacterium]
MTDGIFISYRRDDSLGWSGRIYDQLWPVFGKDRVFFDLDSLYPGSDWDEAIDRTVEQAAIVVLIVGPRWATLEDKRGNPRIHDENDKHAYEVATALASGKPVIPVTIDGAVMPDAAELPESLQRLTKKQAFTLTPAAYYHEIKVLVDLLARVVQPLGEGAAGAAPDVVATASGATSAVAPTAVDEPPPAPAGESAATAPVDDPEGPDALDHDPPLGPVDPADSPDEGPTGGPTPPPDPADGAEAEDGRAGGELDAANEAEQRALDLARSDEFGEALRIERGVLEVRTRLLREDHPHTLLARSNIGLWLAATGEVEEAERELRRTLGDRQRVLGPQHAETLATQVELANLLYRQGDVAGAKALEVQVLEARRRTLGDTHPDTLTAMRNLVISQRALAQFDEAVPLLRELAEVAGSQEGARSPGHLDARQALALSLFDGGDVAEALAVQRAVVADWAATPDEPGGFAAQFVLGCWLRESGDLAGAREVEQRSLSGRARVLGPDDPETLDSAANLAVTLFQLNDLVGSKALFADVVERRRRVLGPDHADTLSAERALDSAELAGVELPDDRHGLPSVDAPTGVTPDPPSADPPSTVLPSAEPPSGDRVPAPAPAPAVDTAAPPSAEGPVLRVAPDGGGDHESIAAALRVAVEETTVVVAPGQYPGTVVVNHPGVRIIAEAAPGSVVVTAENAACVVVNGTGCALEGLVLVRQGKKDGPVVEVLGGDLLVDRCDLSGSGTGSVVGVSAPKAAVHVRDSEVHDVGTGVEGRTLTVEDTRFRSVSDVAVDAKSGERLDVARTTIEGSRHEGIRMGSTAVVLGRVTGRIVGCQLVACGDVVRAAVGVGKGCTLHMEDCRIEQAEGFGLEVGKTGEAALVDTQFLDIGQKFLRDKANKPFQGAIKLGKGAGLDLTRVQLDGHPLDPSG